MNIQISCLHVITRLANGGAEESVMDMILQLAKHKIFCDIAIGKELLPATLEKFPLPPQCNIYRIPHLIRQVHPVYDIYALQELKKLIIKNKYTVVHTHASKAGIIGRIAAHQVGTDIIIGNIHGISFPKSAGFMQHIYKTLEKHTAKMSTALVCVGQDIKNIYLNAGIGEKNQYVIIYTGMDLSPYIKAGEDLRFNTHKRIIARKQIGLSSTLDHCVLSYIGRLDKSKNQQELLYMMPHILTKYPNTQLCLVGDGPAEKKLKKLTKKLKLTKNVIFAGYIKNVWEIMSAFDIHCFTSLREGLPRVLVQTSAACIPTISYEVEGVSEIIEDSKSGFIVKQHNTATFLEKLFYLLKNKNQRLLFGLHAMQKADSRWSLEKLGNNTKALYQKHLRP